MVLLTNDIRDGTFAEIEVLVKNQNWVNFKERTK